MPRKKETSDLSATFAFLEDHSARWVVLGVLFFAGAGIIFFANDWFQRGFEKDSRLTVVWKEDVVKPVRVTVDYGGGKKRAFQGEVPGSLAAADIIRAAAEAGNFTVRFDTRGAITEVDGVRARAGLRWQWYLNDSFQNDSAESVVVRGGDTLVLRYGTP